MATRGIGKGARSARGEIVDFDLLRIKENLATAPKGSTVKAREDFIDNKFKRRLRRLTEATAGAPAVSSPAAPPVVIEPPVAIEEYDETPDVVEDVVPVVETPAPTRKRTIKSPSAQ